VPGDLVAGKYRVDRVLGAGGMGVVVAATHEQLDQRVALKFLQASVALRVEIVQRFLREARAAVKIHSEHVARVLDVGTLENGVPFMVMEYLDGEDLSRVIAARGSLPVQETVGYVLEACEAVAEAHSLGIVHRDLKPANLFLARRPTGKPVVKVLDFGISKVSSNVRNDAITKTSSIMGSPGYMSPEQMVDAKSVDFRSDVWSFGVVLYEMLSGRLPFAGDTMPELVAAILQKTPTPLGSLRADVPVGLQVVVDRCLRKEVAGRYENIADLARALAPFGPPRGEQSVERIEAVLGLEARRQIATMTASEELFRHDLAPRDGSAQGNDPATLQPTTTAIVRQRWGFFFVPAAIVLAAAAAALAFALRAPRGPLSPPEPATSAARSAASAGVPVMPVAPPVALPPVDPPAAMLAPLPASAAPAPPVPGSASAPAPSSAPAPRKAPPAPSLAKPELRPSASSSQPPPGAAPTCRVVSYFDSDGQKHFRQECP
jgi:serine/threonine-protein kinase